VTRAKMAAVALATSGAFLVSGHKGILEVAAGIPDRFFDRDVLMG